jgi:hypothetical protein
VGIYSIWESRFPPPSAAEGLAVTEAIWADMPGYDGYLEHVVLIDGDALARRGPVRLAGAPALPPGPYLSKYGNCV